MIHISSYKRRSVDGEQRWHAIGRSSNELLLLVVHTETNDDGQEYIRLISARPVVEGERGHIVQYIPDYDAPPSPETLARLEKLRHGRDEDIDLSDAPPLPEGGNWVRARDLGFAWAQPRPGQRPSRRKDAA